MTTPHSHNEAGRKLLAALISYQAGYVGVDRILKQAPEVVDESWAILAEYLLIALNHSTSAPLEKMGIHRVK